jgi:hypothetical protein
VFGATLTQAVPLYPSNSLTPAVPIATSDRYSNGSDIAAEPSKDTPAMILAVANTVAAPAVRPAAVPVMLVPVKATGVPNAVALPDASRLTDFSEG